MNKDNLIKGEFYLWKVARQATTDVDLYSVYFITEEDKTYEVVFTKHDAGNPTPAWYLVEKKVADEKSQKVGTNYPVSLDPHQETQSDTLEIRVEDELDVKALFGGGD